MNFVVLHSSRGFLVFEVRGGDSIRHNENRWFRPTRRPLYRCNRRRKRISLTAGTILHSTKLPLTVWFAAIHPIMTAGHGILSVEPGHWLGIGQARVQTMKRRIMAVTARREVEKPLSGRVGTDDAHPYGMRSGRRRGRSAPGRTPFAVAVPTGPEGRLHKAGPVPVGGLPQVRDRTRPKVPAVPDTEVVTDALGRAGRNHRAIRTGSGRRVAHMMPFK